MQLDAEQIDRPGDLITVAELAAELRLTKGTIYNHIGKWGREHGIEAAIKKSVDRYFDQMAKGNPDTTEYVAVKSALMALLDSIPDSPHLIQIVSWGSASVPTDAARSRFNARIDINLLTPTIADIAE
jgi:AcrR family transcriptional regulator